MSAANVPVVDEALALDEQSPREPRSGTVVVNGLRVNVVVRGHGRPLLLIGGIGANVEMCEPFAEAIRHTQLIMFDMPGCGRSSTPSRPLTMAGLASIVEGLLDGLELEQVDVLGVSMGGAVAQQLARQAPDRVRRLVLVATACGAGMVPGRPWALGVMATPLRYYSTTFFKLVAPIFLGGEKWRDRDFVHEHAAARRSKPPSLKGYYMQAFGVMTFTSLPWLHTLPHQTLVLSGDDDPIVPAINGAVLAHRIRNARHHVVRGGGHLFMIDSPDEVAPLVEEFLGDVTLADHLPAAADARAR
ncbi:MAG: alpha/beta fold hydrolase [Solirubrobacteraceae bacterium]